ncbi:MAG TPA: YidB family protein, partial [Usitatibacteraceae bacterium]|nr:YidB family protein [Usitatibacteraceae bacterium]
MNMGLLDGLLGSLMGGGQQQGGSNPLVQIAMDMLLKGQQGSGAQGGGLGDLINTFRNAGMGQQVDSWISTGENMPIDGDQLSHALGSDRIRDIASQLGLGQGDVAGGLAKVLPELINQVTPTGQVPQDSNVIGDLLGSLM